MGEERVNVQVRDGQTIQHDGVIYREGSVFSCSEEQASQLLQDNQVRVTKQDVTEGEVPNTELSERAKKNVKAAQKAAAAEKAKNDPEPENEAPQTDAKAPENQEPSNDTSEDAPEAPAPAPTRKELNEEATSLGIEDAKKLPNIKAVQEAIAAKKAEAPAPEGN